MVKKGQLPKQAIYTPPAQQRPTAPAGGDQSTPGTQTAQNPAGAIIDAATAHQVVIAAGFDVGIPSADEVVIANLLRSGSDSAVEDAKAYYRGTAYHEQLYPSYAAGIKNGIFGDEAGYSAWRNTATDTFNRYYGRPPTSQELSNFSTLGYHNSTIEQIGGGHAWATANTPEVQYELGAFDTGQVSQADLETLGQNEVGRNSTQGTLLQNKFETAVQKMRRVFEGTLANPNFNLGGAGLQASGLQGTKPKPDTPA